jgi:hypothetical protein
MSAYAIVNFKAMLEKIDLIERRFGRKSEQYFKAVKEYGKLIHLAVG